MREAERDLQFDGRGLERQSHGIVGVGRETETVAYQQLGVGFGTVVIEDFLSGPDAVTLVCRCERDAEAGGVEGPVDFGVVVVVCGVETREEDGEVQGFWRGG